MTLLRVDLGSGRQAMEAPDYIHVDKWAGEHIEYVWDLEGGLPKNMPSDDAGKIDALANKMRIHSRYGIFKNNTVDEFRAHHIFEHISQDNFMKLMDEAWDALKPDGLLHIWVPNGRHIKAAWSDPTHKRIFLEETFQYWTHATLAAFPYTTKEWTIDDGFPRVNGTPPDDLWELECVMRPVK